MKDFSLKGLLPAAILLLLVAFWSGLIATLGSPVRAI